MARSRMNRPKGWHFNMTPLIDVTFLLLTYFMLASHYASAEKPDIALPKPHESQAEDRPLDQKVYVNLLFDGPNAEPVVMLGPVRMESTAELGQRLAGVARTNPSTQVVLRADRNVRYGSVRETMEVIAAANLPRLQVVAELEHRP